MDNKSKVYLTKEGLDKLKSELKELIEVKRIEIAQKIKEAREMGDISENSAYDTARQEQSFIEGRITELEEVIKNSVVSEVASKDHIDLGCEVTLHVDGDEETYTIVGPVEANPVERKISNESPLGVALAGKKVGEKIEVEVPVGKLIYTVLKIKY